MRIVTLTTDFGLNSPHVAIFKAKLLKSIGTQNIIDISHSVKPFNKEETAYIVKSSYAEFPKGSIHVIGVDSEFSSTNIPILVYYKQHYFLGTDNGIITMITNDDHSEMIALQYESDDFNLDFSNLYSSTIQKIVKQQPLSAIGTPYESISKTIVLKKQEFIAKRKQIRGSVIFIDAYGNAITNLTKDFFKKHDEGIGYEISINKIHEIDTISSSYGKENLHSNYKREFGSLVVFWNSANHLEIAIYKGIFTGGGTAETLFGLDTNSEITLTFN